LAVAAQYPELLSGIVLVAPTSKGFNRKKTGHLTKFMTNDENLRKAIEENPLNRNKIDAAEWRSIKLLFKKLMRRKNF